MNMTREQRFEWLKDHAESYLDQLINNGLVDMIDAVPVSEPETENYPVAFAKAVIALAPKVLDDFSLLPEEKDALRSSGKLL
jgi:hypothetical protein